MGEGSERRRLETPYVFVTYARADSAVVIPIIERLQAAGVRIWWDQTSIEGGVDYAPEIALAIQECAAVLVMASEASLRSREVRQELKLAWQYKRPYLPLLLQPTPIPTEVEYWLVGVQWIEVQNRPETEWLQRVLAALFTLGAASPEMRAEVSHDQRSPAAAPAISEPPPPPLPLALTGLVGRKRELKEVRNKMRSRDVRLLSLIGPAGVGKTRLAVQAAVGLQRDFIDGVIFVPLATVADPELVGPAIGQVLKLPGDVRNTATEHLRAYFHKRKTLLLLDNFEHVLTSAILLVELLQSCPRLKIMVTSRSPLDVRGEKIYEVSPLELPDPEARPDPTTLHRFDAVALFVERATDLNPRFRLTASNADLVARLCRHVDGLPLAIELVAARATSLIGVDGHPRSDQLLDLLGPRDLPDRQRSLRATIDWSYGLLSEQLRQLLRRLGVFVGGCTVAAAHAVCDDDNKSSSDMLPDLEALRQWNLVTRETDAAGKVRFGMLEILRDYALELLSRSDEGPIIRQRHVKYFLSLAEEANAQLRGPSQVHWFEQLELERGNLAAAVDETTRSDTQSGLILVSLLRRFWERHGHLLEGLRYAEALLAADDTPSHVRAEVLNVAGTLAFRQGDYDHARKRFEESLRLGRDLNDQSLVGLVLNSLANVAWATGDYDSAKAAYLESLDIRRANGELIGQAATLNNLGTLASDQGDYPEAWARHQEALEIRRSLGDVAGIAQSLQNLAEVALRRGDPVEAVPYFCESLSLFKSTGDRVLSVRNVEGLARVAASVGQWRLAAKLFGAGEALRSQISIPVERTDQANFDRTTNLVRAELGETEYKSLWESGKSLSPRLAIDEALAACEALGAA